MYNDKVWEELAAAIVERAAIDYHAARFFLDTIDSRPYSDESQKKTKINLAKKTIKEVEAFFNSEWFATIMPDLNGPKAFKALKNTYETEVRDKKMEKFLNGPKFVTE